MSDKERVYREDVLKILSRCGLYSGSVLGSHSGAVELAEAEIEPLPAAQVIPIDWIEAQVDKGKWAELVQRWREEQP